MHIVGQVIEGLLWFFIALLWIRFVVDWVQVFARSWSPRGPLLVLLEVRLLHHRPADQGAAAGDPAAAAREARARPELPDRDDRAPTCCCASTARSSWLIPPNAHGC